MDAPNYVQGLYTVAQRDAIFTKANKYPDAADGLQNQVPTIFPDGSIGWRQIPEGGDGTANANIAVVEQTQYASKNYSVGDLLIYNGQLYRVSTPIAAGGTITPETNVVSTTATLWASESFVPLVGKGDNLLDNAYFIGGGTPGKFPVNQRGATGTSAYPNNGAGIDRWHTANGASIGVLSGGVTVYSATQFGAFRQNLSEQRLTEGAVYTMAVLTDQDLYSFQLTPNKSAAWNGTPYEDGFYPYLFWDSVKARWVFALASNANASGATHSITIKAAKLELGSQQTLARKVGNNWVLNDPPPNYQQELSKCQRYLHIIKTDNAAGALIGSGYVDSGVSNKQILITVYSPVTMNPITSLQTSGVGVISDGAIRALDAVSVFAQAGNIITLNLTSNTAISTAYAPATAYIFNSGFIMLSAE